MDETLTSKAAKLYATEQSVPVIENLSDVTGMTKADSLMFLASYSVLRGYPIPEKTGKKYEVANLSVIASAGHYGELEAFLLVPGMGPSMDEFLRNDLHRLVHAGAMAFKERFPSGASLPRLAFGIEEVKDTQVAPNF